MRILIVGGTKFIGYFVTRILLESGEHEIALFNRGNNPEDIPDGVQIIVGDRNHITEYRDKFKVFAPDVVLNMIPFSEDDTQMFMDACKGIAQRVVGISSCDVYRAYDKLIGNDTGEPDPIPLREDSPLREELYPYRNYEGMDERYKTYDKILVERVIMADSEMPGTILRLPVVYGPRDYQHRLFSYLKRMDDNRPQIILEKDHAHWQMARGYAEDMAYAISLAVIKDEAAGQIYNVCEEKCFTELAWIELVGEAVGWSGEIVILPNGSISSAGGFNPSQQMVISSEKIRKELGYQEQISRTEALKRTIAWERKNPPAQINPQEFDYEKEDEILTSRKNS